MKLGKKITALLLLTLTFLGSALFLLPAKAVDIPLLTWEKGKEQSIQLAGYPGKSNWNIILKSTDTNTQIKPLKFQRSFSNGKNLYYYSLFIPQSTLNGNYIITAGGNGIAPSEVAAVHLIDLNYYQITEIPVDLLVVLGFYVFLTAALSGLRIRKHSKIFFLSRHQDLTESWPPVELSEEEKPNITARYRHFLNSLTDNLQASLFKTILIKDRAQLEVLSPKLWSISPLLSVVLGIVGSLEQIHLGGIASAPIWIYFALALISIFDLFSGILAFASFFLIQLFFGHPSSFREVLAMALIGFALVGPAALFASLTSLIEVREQGVEIKKRYYEISEFLAATISGVLFYVGLILVLSLKINVSSTTGVGLVYPSALVLLILAKETIFNQALVVARRELEPNGECFEREISIGRIISPTTTTITFLGIVAIFYTWLESWTSGLLIAILLTLPYALLFIQITEIKVNWILKIKRSWVLEGLITFAFVALAFIGIEKFPGNTLQRSHLFIFVAMVPLILHSIFSALWDGNDRRVAAEALETSGFGSYTYGMESEA